MTELTARIPVVIPSYEPDENLLTTCRSLQTVGITNILIVDDGSGAEYRPFFEAAQRELGCTVLTHEVNRGKGRALKTAFTHILEEMPAAIGCVTADSDGQHLATDILACMRSLEENPDALVLGCRDFGGEDVPTKSRFGNELTKKVCSFLCGVKVSDTQTGLRGISVPFMRHLLTVAGERFEFETNMLIECKDRVRIVEVPIETVYDSKENHKTHFHPIKDSIRIYRIFGKIFFKYILSSVSSCVIDLLLFALFCSLFRDKPAIERLGLSTGGVITYIALATVLARVISSVYNCLINAKVVFKTRKNLAYSCVKYFSLVIVQMCASALLTTLGVALIPVFPEVVVKAIVDTVLFFCSFYIQRRFVF